MNTYQETQLNALGDATRRAILARLLTGPLAVGELARDFPVSRPAISQHLRVLKDANLVLDRPEGNRRLYQLNPAGFDPLREYFDQFWNHALATYKEAVEAAPTRGGLMTTVSPATEVPVRKTIAVKATVERAFQVFTEGIGTWWPSSHHIGKAPLEKAVFETRAGGRCYGRSVDGTECDWGRILVWEPPHRFVMAWQITAEWQYEPDLAKSSEVEVRFNANADGSTRIDLEHRHFHRHGDGAASVKAAVDAPNGWGGLLELFAAQAART